MHIRSTFPSADTLEKWHTKLSKLPHSYPEVGQSQGQFPAGYDHDYNEVQLGHGRACFEQAKIALKDWQMFPSSWTRIYPKEAPQLEGQLVLVLFRLLGFWWANPCRIIYTVDNFDHFGFGYGTIAGHVEKGEEYFGVRIDTDNRVWYEVRAFSKPAIWATKLTYPLPRFFQRKFVQGSKAGMKTQVAKMMAHPPQ